ncbi:putative K homology RNA-binding domain containing protein [Lyophyllum shimeji]|uniref:K homology RNA-binding domain containing protein n=1 Tax=Lyophyllum shimeji TaxID=47721 RepID=A0A9P3PRV6_LYOSH|nr:putative K homology RNA-binding domain containing protein [Lyophyllum shimeji]
MSSKRKWDQPGPTSAEPAPPSDLSPPAPTSNDKDGTKDSKSAADAAAAAAAIAAKIAAQFSAGALAAGAKEEGAFARDIDINDVRNRYMLTKSSTQQQIHEETGASVSTKGVWYPDRSKATEKDPPLYLHVTAPTAEALQKAIDKINELMAIDLGSLVEDKKDRLRERRKWPEEKLPVGLESIRNFNVRAKVVGPSGSFVKYIQQETGARVQIKGIGSGFIDQETGREGDEPLYIHITSPEESQVARAKVLTEDLLLVVRSEHAKMQAILHQQQMELHQAQAQYAAYSAMAQGYAQPPPPPPNAPPPPPGEQPPPPPGAGGYDPSQPQAAAAAAGAPAPGTDAASQDAYAAYWAAYGYDVNSPQFKEWAAQQQQQYSQYYAAQGYGAGGAAASGTPASAPPAPAPAPGSAPAPPPAGEAPPPPPPPA